ncbi:hypothetical protein [Actinomycetospora chiangmaiensis]|uniref:hypothetical protein n=1 Tax=Actinomycetospora chiangmaiensis TaxID=402650 RepID=UPI000367D89A|nr:hypothetical protein [Actinomycetospora chiangmaiensis]
MTIPVEPTDTLPDPGTDAGWVALEREAHAHGYVNAQAYVAAYEQGGMNVGIAGYQPGNAHTGFGQIQAYERAAGQSGETLHDFAAQHTPEALAADRGELPDQDPGGPGFDRHALRDEAHLHGYRSVGDYVRAFQHGDLDTSGVVAGTPNGFRQVEALARAADGHGEDPDRYFHEHRQDHDGHHPDPSGGGVTDGNPPLHDEDWWKQPQSQAQGDPDPGQIDHTAGYPGAYVGPVTVGPDGTRTLPDGSHLGGEGADTLRIYPNGNVQDPSGRYLGDYHGEWRPGSEIDPSSNRPGLGATVGPDHGMDGTDAGAASAGGPPAQQASGGDGRLVHETVHFGGGDTPQATGSDPGFGGGAHTHPGQAHGQAAPEDAVRHGDPGGGADDTDHDLHHDVHLEPPHGSPESGHESDSHGSAGHHDDGGHENSHDAGLDHHVG